MANKKPLMGIENEFKLLRAGEVVSGSGYFDDIRDKLSIPYFQKGPSCIRLATGGSFYIDGKEPEVTSAPFYVEPGQVTSLANNLFLSINSVIAALNDVNTGNGAHLHLNGYSAHYSFTFPEITKQHQQVAYLLATTVNPALQLLLENRKSSGLMYRYRENGRLEICGDFVPDPNDVIAATGLQAALLHALDYWLRSGTFVDEVRKQLRFSLPDAALPVMSRLGYKLPTPQVITQGRRAIITMNDAETGETAQLTAQDLLEYLVSLVQPTMEEVLSVQEEKILHDSIEGKRRLPIDSVGYPQGYNNVSLVPVDPRKAVSPLTKALGNAVKERTVNGGKLVPQQMDWSKIQFCYQHNGSSGQLYVPLDDLVAFEALLEQHPELMEPLLQRRLTGEQVSALQQLGFSEPYALLEKPTAEEPSDFAQYFNTLGRVLSEGELIRERRQNSNEEMNFFLDYISSNQEIIESYSLYTFNKQKIIDEEKRYISKPFDSFYDISKYNLSDIIIPKNISKYDMPDDQTRGGTDWRMSSVISKVKENNPDEYENSTRGKRRLPREYRTLEEILSDVTSLRHKKKIIRIREP